MSLSSFSWGTFSATVRTMKPGAGRAQPVDDLAQPAALLLVGDAAADADVVHRGHEHQVPAGDGDVRGEAGALGADGVLGDLDDAPPGPP